MKKVQLQSLVIRNFKGIKEFEIEFSDRETNIRGANGTGKTTIVDAFMWLMYGKNSANASDFSIKPLTKDNKAVHKLDYEVTAVFQVSDDSEVLKHKLTRILRENWQRKRGTEETELKNETVYFHNDVPVGTQKEFKAIVESIISEDISKLITNPLFFNSNDPKVFSWQQRRSILSTIAGEISDSEIADAIKASDELRAILSSSKTIADHKKEASAKKKVLKDELEKIPVQIDEANRAMPEVLDWPVIESQIEGDEKRIASIDEQINDKVSAQQEKHKAITKAKDLKFEKQNQLTELKRSLTSGITETVNKLRADSSRLKGDHEHKLANVRINNGEIETLKSSIAGYQKQIDDKRAEWVTENAKTWSIDPAKCECPTCKRPLEKEAVDQLVESGQSAFETSKRSTLNNLVEQAASIQKSIEESESSIEKKKASNLTLQAEADEAKKLLDEVEPKLSAALEQQKNQKETPEEISIQNEIEAVVIPTIEPVDDADLKQQKANIQKEIDELKTKLSARPQIETQKKRMADLEERERELSQELADVERFEMSLDQFNKSKIEMIEARVNGMFPPLVTRDKDGNEHVQNIRVKMFEQQQNGGENEICEMLIDGVPFTDANTASKINAGIAVINVLSEFYQVSGPIFIDGKESVTSIIVTPAQLVNLIVDENNKSLTVYK